MGCQIQSPNPQILCGIPQNKCISGIQTRNKSCSFKIQNQEQQPISISTVTQKQVPKPGAYGVKFETLGACKIGIARYPDFEYNAQGGRGTGTGKTTTVKDFNGDTSVSVDFDVKSLYIPPLTTATTKFLGLPLPPLLKIDIVPEIFRGSINQESGKVDLNFKAKFWFSIGSIYRAPPLQVETLLTSEESKGTLRRGRGERLNEEGRCRLVGVATIDPIDDFLMNSFLGLPTECLANLNATISFSSKL